MKHLNLLSKSKCVTFIHSPHDKLSTSITQNLKYNSFENQNVNIEDLYV